jgi:hypothetical protein
MFGYNDDEVENKNKIEQLEDKVEELEDKDCSDLWMF